MHGRGVVWLVAGLVGVACGSSKGTSVVPPPTGDGFVEGSRLQAHWVQAPGAPRLFVGWFDRQLGEDCTFELAGDIGRAHPAETKRICRPRSTSATGELFGDAACTQMVADVPCGDVHFAQLPAADNNDCTSSPRLYRVGDPVTTGIYARVSGVCTLVGPTDAMRAEAPHLLGDELLESALVTAQVQVASGNGRIVQTTLEASDGSRQVVGAWDTVRDEGVFPPDWPALAAGGSNGRWEPEQILERIPNANVFSDATCRTVATGFSPCGEVAVRSLFERPSVSCSTSAKYYEAGAQLGVGTAFFDDGDPTSCRPVAAGDVSGSQLYAVGAPIPPSSLADVQSFEQGTGAVRIHSPGSSAGAIGAGQAYLYDTAHAVPCSGYVAADGVLRCLPREITTTYGDPACTVPVLALSASDPACPAPPALTVIGVVEAISSDACGEQYKLHEYPVAGSHGGLIYDISPATGGCEPIPAGVAATLNRLDTGPEIPPSEFAALTTPTLP